MCCIKEPANCIHFQCINLMCRAWVSEPPMFCGCPSSAWAQTVIRWPWGGGWWEFLMPWLVQRLDILHEGHMSTLNTDWIVKIWSFHSHCFKIYTNTKSINFYKMDDIYTYKYILYIYIYGETCFLCYRWTILKSIDFLGSKSWGSRHVVLQSFVLW